jgi:hypothetical protein
MRLIVATTREELDRIPVHDAWFDVDEVVQDEAKRTLVLPFAQEPDQTADAPEPQLVRRRRLSNEYRAPLVGWVLTVHNVREVRAKEGWADMGMLLGVAFDAVRRQLTIESNGKLDAVVDALRVEASGGTDVVRWSRRRIGPFGVVSDTPWR